MSGRHPEIEERHRRDIEDAGRSPDSLTLEAQLATWERRLGSRLSESDVERVRELSAVAPSRYEIVDYLDVYEKARLNVVTMQEMSADRQRFAPADLVVATDLAGLGDPRVETVWPAVHDASAETDSVIWIPLMAVKQMGVVANVFGRRLVTPAGHPATLIDALAYSLSWTEVLDVLRRGQQPTGLVDDATASHPRSRIEVDFVDMAEDARAAVSLVELALATFMVGHEAGHIYYRHTGVSPLPGIFTGPPPVPQSWVDEASADAVGIAATWDGMNSNQEVSIDESWLGPILSLAYHAGREAAQSPEAHQNRPAVQAWLFRLRTALGVLGQWLRGNGFEAPRAARILAAATSLAAGFYEYVRTGGDAPHQVETLGEPGSTVFDVLEGVALAELHAWL